MTRKLANSDFVDISVLLPALRREARLSQKELAQLAGLARSAISAIERGLSQPKATTLRLIARGLATDGAGHHNEAREQAYYTQLMQASGYLSSELTTYQPMRRSAGEWTEQELRDALARRANNPAFAALLLEIAERYSNSDEHDRSFMNELVRRILN